MGAIRNFRSDAIQTLLDNIDANALNEDGSASKWDNVEDGWAKFCAHFSGKNKLEDDLSNLDGYLAYIMETDDITAKRLEVILDGVKEVEDDTTLKFRHTTEELVMLTNRLKAFEEQIGEVAPLEEGEERLPDGGAVINIPDAQSPPEGVPEDKVPRDIPVFNYPGQRSAEAYRRVLEALKVEEESRYQPRSGGRTYCNFFVWDATIAMGCEIPHLYDSTTGEKVEAEDFEPYNAETGKGNPNHLYMSANRMCDWLRDCGPKFGWNKVEIAYVPIYDENGAFIDYQWEPADAVTKITAQGKPVVAAWNSGSSSPGHVAMMLPPQPGDTTMMLAQAGGTNYNRKGLEYGFGKDKWPTLCFYYHN